MCHQYWPTSDITQYGSITVELNEETERGDYVMRDMTVTKVSPIDFSIHYITVSAF